MVLLLAAHRTRSKSDEKHRNWKYSNICAIRTWILCVRQGNTVDWKTQPDTIPQLHIVLIELINFYCFLLVVGFGLFWKLKQTKCDHTLLTLTPSLLNRLPKICSNMEWHICLSRLQWEPTKLAGRHTSQWLLKYCYYNGFNSYRAIVDEFMHDDDDMTGLGALWLVSNALCAPFIILVS